MHTARPGMPQGCYILAASLADPDDCEPIRDSLLRLRASRNGKLHWTDESPQRRRLIATAIAAFPLDHTVVLGAPLDARKQERARAQCLEQLLFDLGQRGVASAWVETRGPALDRADLKRVDAFRSRGVLPRDLHVGFGQPATEPMLWLPDILAGAVGVAVREGDRSLLNTFAPALAIRELELR